jgi:hypothetical protein
MFSDAMIFQENDDEQRAFHSWRFWRPIQALKGAIASNRLKANG